MQMNSNRFFLLVVFSLVFISPKKNKKQKKTKSARKKRKRNGRKTKTTGTARKDTGTSFLHFASPLEMKKFSFFFIRITKTITTGVVRPFPGADLVFDGSTPDAALTGLLPSFTASLLGLQRVVPHVSKFLPVLLGFTGFNWVLPSFTGF